MSLKTKDFNFLVHSVLETSMDGLFGIQLLVTKSSGLIVSVQAAHEATLRGTAVEV